MARVASYLCHQAPERCLKIKGWTMPVCSRCTGFYSGILIGLVFNFFIRAIVHAPWYLILLAVGIGLAPMAIDGFTQLWGWRESNNGLRLGTGLMAGFVCGLIVIYLAESAVLLL